MTAIQLTRYLVGQLDIPDGVLTVTDPCYNEDVPYRMNGLKVVPGQYNCYAYTGNKCDLGTHVWIAQIVFANGNLGALADIRASIDQNWVPIGEIGVDAGLAGFFPGKKPDFNDKQWATLCQWMSAPDMPHTSNETADPVRKAYLLDGTQTHPIERLRGFWTESGNGDGEPTVAAVRINGEIVALEIRF